MKKLLDSIPIAFYFVLFLQKNNRNFLNELIMSSKKTSYKKANSFAFKHDFLSKSQNKNKKRGWIIL